MARRFNPAPGWPPPPPGWTPPPGWKQDPAWPPAPPGWRFWITEPGADQDFPGGSNYAAESPAFRLSGTAEPPRTAAPGWVAPDADGPGFSAWAAQHRLLVAVLGLIIALVAYWLGGSLLDPSPSPATGPGALAGPAGSAGSAGSVESTPRGEEERLDAALAAAFAPPGPLRPGGPDQPGPSSPTAPRFSTGTGRPVPVAIDAQVAGIPETPVRVVWTIDGSVRGAAAKAAARRDVVKILATVRSTVRFPYDHVSLLGKYPLAGPGSPPEDVIFVWYRRATVDSLDFSRLDPATVLDRADVVHQIDPSMRGSL